MQKRRLRQRWQSLMHALNHHIGPGPEEGVGLGGRQPDTGDVLPVDDGELDIFQLSQGAQALGQVG